MPLLLQRRAATAQLTLAATVLTLAGCASPGPPHSPSLFLPTPVTTLTATRQGAEVELRFILPHLTTDNLPLRAATIAAQLCRAVDNGPCIALPTVTSFPRLTADHPTVAHLTDPLPPELLSGPPHPLLYRVQLFNDIHHTAGFSDAAYTAAGAIPTRIESLTAQGSRLGIVLAWKSPADDTSQLVIRRESLAPAPAKAPATPKPVPNTPTVHASNPEDEPNVVYLTLPTSSKPTNTLLDTTAIPDTPYSYTAQRRRTLTLNSRTLELRSDYSAPIQYELHEIYPPAAPTDLVIALFEPVGTTALKVDLIWQPVLDANLAGYNLYRQPIDTNGNPTGVKIRLNKDPITLPSFSDPLPSDIRTPWRYWVTAVDTHGNESTPATTSTPEQAASH